MAETWSHRINTVYRKKRKQIRTWRASKH